MRASLTFGKIFGIPIGVHSSWFLIAALITWSLAGGYLPQENPTWSSATYRIVGVITAVANASWWWADWRLPVRRTQTGG